MDTEKLKTAVAERQRAITAFREAQDEEPRQKAWVAAEEQNATINAGVAELSARLDAIEDAEVRARQSYDEAHPEPDPVWGSKDNFNQAIRAMLQNPGGPMLRAQFPVGVRMPAPGESRTDYPLLTAGTTTNSNYIIPTMLWQDLTYHINAQSGILQAGATVIRTPGNATIDVPVLLTDPVAAAGTEGAAQSNAAYPVFSKISLKAYRSDGFMSFTDEMARSSEYPIYDVLTEVANRSLAVMVATDLAIGAGTTRPDGLFISATADCSAQGVTASSTTSFTLDNLLDMLYSVNAGYRANGSFILTTPAMKVLAKLKTGEGGYAWQPTVIAGQPDRLFGRPVYEEAYGDANGAIATGEEHVVFGDMSKFWIRFAGPIDISASRDMKFTEWEVVLRFAAWMDCNVIDVQAFSVLTQA